MKRILVTILLLTGAVLITAAVRRPLSVIAAGEAGRVDDLSQKKDEIREEFHQSYPLSATGRLSLENINGSVHITVWDQNQVKVDAVKRAYTRERLDEVRIEVETITDGVRIRTRYPDHDRGFDDDGSQRYNNPASVDYSLTVPRQARLQSIDVINGPLDIEGAEGDVKASSINGHLKAAGLMGEAKLATINGPLEATFTKLNEAKSLTLNSVNGSVTLIIPSDANAQIKAGTVHGGISNDFGLPVKNGHYVGHELNGQLGAGGPRIKLGNVNGGITIKHANDGRPVSQAINQLPDTEKEDEDVRKVNEEARQIAQEARAEARAQIKAQVDAQRIAREAQAEVDRAMRESQREIQRAQAEMQRDLQRQIRDQVRAESDGAGRGVGRGGGRVVDQESKSFTVTGVPSINVGTFDGAVVVNAWDKSEVSYTAIKRANSEEAIKRISMDANQQGNALSIIAKSEHSNGSVALEVNVPRNSNLHVSSGDGRVLIQGVSGELIARTGDGSIEIQGGKGRLQLNTGDGRIQVTNFQGEADARTGDGSITLEGKFSAVSARTGDGSITLGVPADSNFTVETNADTLTSEGLSVSEEVAPSTRVKRWKVGRGGAVFTLTTGEGAVIVRRH